MTAHLVDVTARGERLRAQLRTQIELRLQARHVPDPWLGWHHLVLERGKLWTPQDYDATRWNVPGLLGEGHCYENAYLLAQEHPELRYVEGAAQCAGCPIEVTHAWCVDLDGGVVDPTWDSAADHDYLGIAIPLEEVARSMEQTGYLGLLDSDWRRDFWFLRTGWRKWYATDAG